MAGMYILKRMLADAQVGERQAKTPEEKQEFMELRILLEAAIRRTDSRKKNKTKAFKCNCQQ